MGRPPGGRSEGSFERLVILVDNGESGGPAGGGASPGVILIPLSPGKGDGDQG